MPFKDAVKRLLSSVEHVNSEAYASNLQALQLIIGDPANGIRFIIFSSGGMGHQSTAANIIYRLAALGLKGIHDVIYFGQDLKKIATLFPQFDPTRPQTPVVIQNATFNFIESDAFEKSAATVQKIGIVGGIDGVNYANYATAFKISYLLALQPYQWKQEDSVIQIGDTEGNFNRFLDKNTALKELSFSKRGYFIADPVMSAAYVRYFQNSQYADKYDTYSLITAAVTGSKVNMMPLYGLAVYDHAAYVGADIMLFNLVTSVVYAQENTNKVSNKVKGAVLTVISELPAETYERFSGLIAGTDDRLTDNPLKEWIAAHSLPERVKLLNYDDHGLPAALTALETNPTHIVVVNMGNLPLYAFNYLYSVADMPTVFEGAATNSLVLNFGKNYFALPSGLNEDFILYPTLPLNAAAPAEEPEAMKDIGTIIQSTLQEWERDLQNEHAYSNPAILIGLAVLIAFESAGKPGPAYFKSLGDFFHSQQEDKMLMGVFYLIQWLNHYKK
ncbi:MAG: hypothetical protein ACHQHN_19925 [Sphingobacteriales bacterium]